MQRTEKTVGVGWRRRECAAFSDLEMWVTCAQSAEGRKPPEGPRGKELVSQEFWWGKSHLTGCTGGHGSEGKDWSSEELWGTGKQEEGGHGQEH